MRTVGPRAFLLACCAASLAACGGGGGGGGGNNPPPPPPAPAAQRNDSIGDATPVGNGTHSASISPAGDPSGTFDPDEDYYAVTTTADSTVTVDIDAQVNGSPVDTVIEIVNASGTQLNRCGAPAYTSPCESDDEQLGVDLDSFLQVRVNGATTFYIHVVDWGSNARPDMLYDLIISGVN